MQVGFFRLRVLKDLAYFPKAFFNCFSQGLRVFQVVFFGQ
jgi:hypothetical protein